MTAPGPRTGSNPLYYLVHVAKVALPLYPQFGTAARTATTSRRAGCRGRTSGRCSAPASISAIERYANPDRELLAVLQLFRRSNRIIFRYEIKEGPKIYEGQLRGKPITLYNDTVIAYGKDGKELFRTTVEEPFHVRGREHANSI